MEFLNITAEYDTLALSRIEGIDTYNSRFNLLVTNLKKKPYDILNHRKDSFDIDFADFKLQLEEFNVSHCLVSHSYMQCVVHYRHSFGSTWTAFTRTSLQCREQLSSLNDFKGVYICVSKIALYSLIAAKSGI